jgi:hypothetical protein
MQGAANGDAPLALLPVENITNATNGGLSVAVNQCAGGAVACHNAVHQLNQTLETYNGNRDSGRPHPLTVENVAPIAWP